MSNVDVASITSVPIRNVWPDEATDFTPWLAANLGELATALGLELEAMSTEEPTGSFSLDILATDIGRQCTVVIENQLERTDHDHLGKLLTYASGHNAAVAVWISREMREEHRQAIDWLNQRTGSDTEFYGVEIRAVSIDGSRPACLFDVVARPNETRKQIVDAGQKALDPNRTRNHEFWTRILDDLRDTHGLTKRRTASWGTWQGIPSHIPWVRFNTWFDGNGLVYVQLSLESDQTETNKEIFDKLEAQKAHIQAKFGEELIWERKDRGKYSCIGMTSSARLTDPEATMVETADWLVDSVLRLNERVMPFVITLVGDIDVQTT